MRSIKNKGKTKGVRELQPLGQLLTVDNKVIGKMRETHECMGVI